MNNLKFSIWRGSFKRCFDILWRLCYINPDIQFILLSATLGNAYDLKDELRIYRKNPIQVIKYNIRPIPLQRIHLKPEIKLTKKGLLLDKKQLENPFSFTCSINFKDPTPRDIKKILCRIRQRNKIFERRKLFYLSQIQ